MSPLGSQMVGLRGAAGSAGGGEVTQQENLVAWWKCEDATDSIGSADLTFTNGASIVAGGAITGSTKSLSCDGVNQYATSAAYDLGSATALSISQWVKSIGSHTDGDGDKVYKSNGYYCHHSIGPDMSDLMTSYGMGLYTSYRFLNWYLMSGGSWATSTYAYYGDPGWDAQDWTLWTLTWESGSKFSVYRNNAEVIIQTTGTVSGSLDDITGIYSQVAKSPLGAYYLDCLFDDMRVYKIKLSTAEIGEIYNSGNGDWPT